MSQENLIREAIETQRSNGWIISSGIWFQFRDGRNPPKASPWGCVLIGTSSNAGGNFHIPQGNWWVKVRDTLQVSDSWLQMFASGFDGKSVSSHWLSQMSLEDLQAYHLGKKMAEEYISSAS